MPLKRRCPKAVSSQARGVVVRKESPCYLWDVIVGDARLEMILKQEDLCSDLYA